MISFRLLFDSAVSAIEATHRAGDSSSFKLRVLCFTKVKQRGGRTFVFLPCFYAGETCSKAKRE